MFSLVQFDDEVYFITTPKNINILQDAECLVKYRGARYHATLIQTSASEEKLQLLLNSLKFERSVGLNHIDAESNLQYAEPPAEIEMPRTSLSDGVQGIGCSTPIKEGVLPPTDQLTLSRITVGNSSTASSAAPSGCTDILNNMGDDWLKDSNEADELDDAIQLRDSNANCAIKNNSTIPVQKDGTNSSSRAQDIEEKHNNLDEQNNNVKHVHQTIRVNAGEGSSQNQKNKRESHNEVEDNGQDNKEIDSMEKNNGVGHEKKVVGGYVELNNNIYLDRIQAEEGNDGGEKASEIQDNGQDNEDIDDIEKNNAVGQEEREVCGYVESNEPNNEHLDGVQDEEGSDSGENAGKIQDHGQDDEDVDDIQNSNGVGQDKRELGYIKPNEPNNEHLNGVLDEEGSDGGENADEIQGNGLNDKDVDIENNNGTGQEKRRLRGYIERNQSKEHNYIQDKERSDDEVSSSDANESASDNEWQDDNEQQKRMQDDLDEETSDDDTAKDSNYIPGSSVSNVTETSRINSTKILSKSIAAGRPVDTRSVNVPPSKNMNARTVKKYFCPFCKKLQTKFARHLELKHKSEAEVKRFMKFPKGNYERAKIIETIRKYGNFLHNTDSDLNTGILITCRQRQEKCDRTAKDYVCCSNCKGFFSKQTLRLHYTKCNKTHEKGVRDIMVMGRRLTGYMHEAASENLRHIVVPVMRDDEITRSLQYDELLVLFANKLCDKYSNVREHDMIRAQLRLLGRFKAAIKDINKEIDDFASVFHPRYYDSAVSAVRKCAKIDPNTNTLTTPAVASTLGTLLKKCIKLRTAQCIKKQDYKGKQDAEDFLVLFEDDFAISINKKVVEAQTKQKRLKTIILPSKEDISKLYNFLKKKCAASLQILKTQFEFAAWKTLNECTLISVQIFNRRRPGEIERLLVIDFENRTRLDETVDPDLYKKLSPESINFAKQFARLAIRGKLGRTVPVILNPLHLFCIETISKYRTEAHVQPDNQYIFCVAKCNPTSKPYLRACDLMRKFSHECGAITPSTLRGTSLRKHIATFFAMGGLGENEIADLANFMGHNQQIHKDIYRVPVPIREVAHVTRLLQEAIGHSDNEEGGGTVTSSDDEPDGTPLKPIPRPTASMKRSAHTNDTSESENPSDDDTMDKSVTKRRSTSPYGKTKRTKWSNEEKNAVRKFFGDPTSLKKLPSLNECQKAIQSCEILKNRQPQVLKTWIDNQRRALSRRNVSFRRPKK